MAQVVSAEKPLVGDLSTPGRPPLGSALDAVRAELIGCCATLGSETVDTADAIGRVLAATPLASRSSPPRDTVAMDGIAVRVGRAGVQAGARFAVHGSALAGDPTADLAVGSAARVMTGAPLPEGADTVVPHELFASAGSSVVVMAATAQWANVRRRGEDVQTGDPLAPVGVALSAQQVAALIAGGVQRIQAVRRPRVALVVTGNEIATGPPTEFQIPDTAGPLVSAAIERSGCQVAFLAHAVDHPDALATVFRRAADEGDAIVSIGGVSYGQKDLTAEVAATLGDIRHRALRLKPGRPFVHGVIAGRPLFGLPGNPGAASAVFELLVAPALRALGGWHEVGPPFVKAKLTESVGPADGRVHALRAVVWVDGSGRLTARVLPGDGSHLVARVAAANALVVLQPGTDTAAGALVDVILTDVPTSKPSAS
ncbi:MAG TPA: molybdopterin molybdotransferase MoeA [Ilumatobacter sp.]|nr:molybdopterin molybdotransferase MoeA [Ilumatobacter sp.]